MSKSKRIIVATIPVRLTEIELKTLHSVHTMSENTSYQKTFVASLSEMKYLQRENIRLEKFIQTITDENEYYKTKWLESLDGKERQEANAFSEEETDEEEGKECTRAEGLPTATGVHDS